MKKVSLFLLVSCFCAALQAQNLEVVELITPSKDRGSSIMKSLADRQSVREFSNKKLNKQDLSDLLWAANGINRPDGRRTAPSAMNKQDVDVYVLMEEGAYLYDPQKHALKPVSKGDHRKLVAGRQASVAEAPVILVLVSDLAKFDTVKDKAQLFGAMDAGYVSQNIDLFCSGTGLATVPRASMEAEELAKALNLTADQFLMLNNPVGYPK